MRKLGRVICLILLLLLLATAAHGAVTMTVGMYFGGITSSWAWCPVLVDLRNDGEAAKAHLSIPDESAQAGETTLEGLGPGNLVVCSRDLQLPAHGCLRCFLYVPAGYTTVGLKVGAESQVIRLSSRACGAMTRTVAVIGGGPTRLLQELDGLPITPPAATADSCNFSDNGPIFAIAHVPWSDLPDQWLGWSGVTAVVLADRQWAQASAEAREALLQWVRLGGTLIVPGGALASAYALELQEALPLQADSLNPKGDLALAGADLAAADGHPGARAATRWKRDALRRRAAAGGDCAAGQR